MDFLTELEKMHEKETQIAAESSNELSSLIASLVQISTLLSSSDSLMSTGANIPRIIKNSQSKLLNLHKDLFTHISKYSKTIDKQFKTAPLTSPGYPTEILNQAITNHLLRAGKLQSATLFAQESGTAIPSSLISEFKEMYDLVSQVSMGDYEGCIDWCAKKEKSLAEVGSHLPFIITKTRFLQILRADKQAALAFAKTKFKGFAQAYMPEIQRLMCALIFPDIEASPYKDLKYELVHETVVPILVRDYCVLLRLPPESALLTAVSVGVAAVPTLQKMSGILKEQDKGIWSMEELPAEIRLDPAFIFHSVFTCPVSKELGTQENPPMMMVCGHVVCRESLMRLGKGSLTSKFKCPYCPVESKGEQAVVVYF